MKVLPDAPRLNSQSYENNLTSTDNIPILLEFSSLVVEIASRQGGVDTRPFPVHNILSSATTPTGQG